MKKVAIGTKPTQAKSADLWIENRSTEPAQEPEKMKRFTFDVPESLHRAVKISCAERGVKIADELRSILIERYGKS